MLETLGLFSLVVYSNENCFAFSDEQLAELIYGRDIVPVP